MSILLNSIPLMIWIKIFKKPKQLKLLFSAGVAHVKLYSEHVPTHYAIFWKEKGSSCIDCVCLQWLLWWCGYRTTGGFSLPLKLSRFILLCGHSTAARMRKGLVFKPKLTCGSWNPQGDGGKFFQRRDLLLGSKMPQPLATEAFAPSVIFKFIAVLS